MPPDRSQLDVLAVDSHAGATVEVSWNEERRRYVLQERLGPGETAVTWRGTDALGRSYAIKFVLRAEYATHSLDAESRRADSLKSALFAKIAFFGQVSF